MGYLDATHGVAELRSPDDAMTLQAFHLVVK
jgi:hypothetical protein